MIGKTIIAEMNRGSLSLPVKLHTRIIKEATGVARNTLIRGEKNIRKGYIIWESTERMTPNNTPHIKPKRMRQSDIALVCQKLSLFISESILFSTSTGEGRRSDCSIDTEAICQIITHITIESGTNSLLCFEILFRNVVEVIGWQISSYSSFVHIVKHLKEA